MALIKEIVDSRGIKTTYHRIESACASFQTDLVEVRVSSYADEEYRDIEKSDPTIETYVKISSYRIPFSGEGYTRPALYEALKLLDYFSGATDDM